jgi:hypothetical protein
VARSPRDANHIYGDLRGIYSAVLLLWQGPDTIQLSLCG